MGYVYVETGRLDLAGPHFERAITLNPNDTGIVAERANWLMYSGRLDEALQCLEVAMRRDPHPPNWVWGVRGMVLFHLQRYEDAIAGLLHWNDPRSWPSMQLAAAYAQAGRIDQARREVARILENEPSAAATDPAHRAQLLEGLRKAGLPE
jgi:adenylate cyclase